MKNNLLYVLAIIFLIVWFIGAFVVMVGKLIHLLLLLSIILILLRVRREKPE
jgi:hypothetical protein